MLKQLGCRFNTLLLTMLSIASIILFASEAGAQCSARDVLSRSTLSKTLPPVASPTTVPSATAIPVWKTITVGTFSGTFAVQNSLDAADCGVGDLAEGILARPAFTLSPAKLDMDLVVLSVGQLGISTEVASLAEIYERGQRLGFRLAAAEIGPQLRIQYFDQPTGEFLNIAMEPIKTWHGEPVILVVANGGSGLLLLGEHASADTQFHSASRFVFVRPREIAKE